MITESALNRDIQEKLKPVKERCYFEEDGRPVQRKERDIANETRLLKERESKLTNAANEAFSQTMRSGNTAESDNANKTAGGQPGAQAADASETNTVTELVNSGRTESQDEEIKSLPVPETSPVAAAAAAVSDVNNQSLAGLNALHDLHNQSPLKRESILDMGADQEILEQVKFDESANVSECFQSALKTWRIYRPNVINIVDQSLQDQHVDELCKFLAGKQMVVRLNLRRNKIGNDGAKILGKFISEGDQALTHIDVTRNRIGEDGGQALLNSLY